MSINRGITRYGLKVETKTYSLVIKFDGLTNNKRLCVAGYKNGLFSVDGVCDLLDAFTIHCVIFTIFSLDSR